MNKKLSELDFSKIDYSGDTEEIKEIKRLHKELLKSRRIRKILNKNGTN